MITLEEALARLEPPSTRAERETVISRCADQKYWTVTSNDPTMIRKLWRAFGPGVRIGPGTVEWCNVPKTAISIRKKDPSELPPPTGCGEPNEPSCRPWKRKKAKALAPKKEKKEAIVKPDTAELNIDDDLLDSILD